VNAPTALERAVRTAGPRIIAALAARFRNLDLAEEGFGDACTRAAETWPRDGEPRDAAAWLYRVAERCVLLTLRRSKTRASMAIDLPEPVPSAEDILTEDSRLIPDERLRLIFVCCHPAVAPESRAALTLRLVCGLSVAEIAEAFLLAEPTLAQRLLRAKRKIAEAGISFEVPGPDQWAERLEAVLSTLEIVYARAHADAAGAGPHAAYAGEILELTKVLTHLLPGEADTWAMAALVRYAEARRHARLGESGAIVPLSQQDPALWQRPLIAEADACLARAADLGGFGARVLQAALHSAWCTRRSLDDPPPWTTVLAIYDRLLVLRDDPIVRLNRAVALAEVRGPNVALDEVATLDGARLAGYAPYHAVRADLLRRVGRYDEARASYDAALNLAPPPAERLWLEQQARSMETGSDRRAE
jgi:RNA polymerase sigma-70 factor (ECF subfamily)